MHATRVARARALLRRRVRSGRIVLSFGVLSLLCALILFVFPLGDFRFRIMLWVVTPWIILWMQFLGYEALKRKRAGTVPTLLMLIVALVVTVRVSSYFSCWCCISHYQMELMCQALGAATAALERMNVPYFLCSGTVMMALRDTDLKYQSAPWEHDIDICIHHRHHAAAMAALGTDSSIVVNVNSQTGQIAVVPNPYPLRLQFGRGYVDIRMHGEETPLNPQAFMAFKLTPSGSIIPFPGDMNQSRAAVGEPSQYGTLRACGLDLKGPADPLAYSVAMFGPIERWENTYQYPPNIHGWSCGLYHDCVIPPHMIPDGGALHYLLQYLTLAATDL